MEYINPRECPYYYIASCVTRFITSSLKEGFASAGLEHVRPAYLGVLLTLWQEGCMKVVQLGSEAGLKPSTVTGLLDRMENDNLVSRCSAPQDRRALLIYPTETGQNIQKPVMEVIEQVFFSVFKGISKQELLDLKDIAQRILVNALEESDGK